MVLFGAEDGLGRGWTGLGDPTRPDGCASAARDWDLWRPDDSLYHGVSTAFGVTDLEVPGWR